MLPISRGGRYTLANVVPACRSCNASKCNAEVTTWLRRKKLDEQVFLVQQVTIRRALTAAGDSSNIGRHAGPNHDTAQDVAVTVSARLRKWLIGLHLNQLWQWSSVLLTVTTVSVRKHSKGLHAPDRVVGGTR